MTKRPGKAAKRAKKKKRTPRFSNQKIEKILAQAREFQRTGQHERAIELCTQTLDEIGEGNFRTARAQMNLLDTRFESYRALLKLDAAEEDVALMLQLATNDTPALKAQALLCQGKILGVRLNFKLAEKTLITALKLARQSDQKYMEVEILRRLVYYQQGEKGIKSAQLAVELSLSLDDRSLAGRCQVSLTRMLSRTGRQDEAYHAAQTALTFCEEAGDNLGKGSALMNLAIFEKDLTLGLSLYKQAYQAIEASGYLLERSNVSNNIGYAYSLIGLYPRALRYYQESITIFPSHYYALSNIIHIELEHNELDLVHLHITDLHSIELDENIKAFREELDGRFALLRGKPNVAVKHIKAAIRISHEIESVREIGELTLLGQAHLMGGNFTAALKATSKAVKMHLELDFPVVDDHPSQSIWWWHAQVLRANGKDEDAVEALERAYEFLLAGIENTRDVGLRRNYFNKVAVNREIIQAWLAYAAKKKLPQKRRYAHLEIESGLREPFARLVESGLELNALHTVEEIQTFLVEEAMEVIGGERVLLILEKDGKLDLGDSYLPTGEDQKKPFVAAKRYLETARISRTVQLLVPKGKGRSRIVAPLVAQDRLLGYLYMEMDSTYGKFDETDRDMLGMLANQGAVALENARSLEGLESTIEERTAELQASNSDLEQRNAELQIINSIQQGLAAELDIQAIFEEVGEKVHNLFDSHTIVLAMFDHERGLIHRRYVIEKGKHYKFDPLPISDPWKDFIQRGRTTLNNFAADYFRRRYPKLKAPAGELPKSILTTPLLMKGKLTGAISIQNMDRENAFDKSDVRLLETIANGMSLALQNAQSFMAEKERVAELQIINSIQQGLAANLD
jgi:GAF domain-containing protein